MAGIGRGLRRHPVWRTALAMALVLLGAGRLSAHKVLPDPTVEVFLKPTGDHLAVKVWLPMIALGDANLPRTPDGHFVQDQIRPALDIVARGIARDLELQDGDDRLAAPAVATTLSPDESFLAIDLDYLVPPGRSDFSARVHPFRGDGQPIATGVHYSAESGATRNFIVDGRPLRISFDPSAIEVVRHFVDEASDLLFASGDFLLFAICLIAAARTTRTTGVAVASLVGGQILVVALSSANLLVLSPATMTVLAALAASSAVVLAIQDVTSPESRWLPALCFAFGALSGSAIAAPLLHDWGFVGTHGAAGLLAFVLTVSIGEIWVVALLWSAAGLIRRRGRIAELAVLSTALFAGHAALHRVIDQGQALADAGTFSLDRFLVTITLGWALLILTAGVVESFLSADAGARPQWLAPPGKIESR